MSHCQVHFVLGSLLCAAASVSPVAGPIFVSPDWFSERRSQYEVIFAAFGPPKDDLLVIQGSTYLNTDEIEYDMFNESTQGVDAIGAKGLAGADLPRNFWQVYPDKYLLPALSFAGVDINSSVVVTGTDLLPSIRVAWTMLKAGVRDVRVLNGGLDAWKAAGYAASSKVSPRRPRPGFGASHSLRRGLNVDCAEARALGAVTGGKLVDSRMKCEYEGTCLPYSYIPVAGRMAGAIWGHASTSDVYHLDTYFWPNNTLKPLDQVSKVWKEVGVCNWPQGASERCAFYCGTGWRSAAMTLIALDLGAKRPANIDGGWMVYSMGPEAPVDPTQAPEAHV